MRRRKRAKLPANISAARSPAGSAPQPRSDLPQAPGEGATAASFATSRRPTVLAAGLIVLAAVAVYHNSFGGTFAYDDRFAIVDNVTIRQLWSMRQVFSPPSSGETVSGRPLLNLSLAMNYALGGLNVWGYHATNLAIHIAAALLLFGVLRRTFLMPTLRPRFGDAATPLAVCSTLLWTVHPLQTESVTYIVQRAESLAGFFYLLTLYCVIRGARGTVPLGSAPSPCATASQKQCESESAAAKGTVPFSLRENWDSPLLWYAAAVFACLLGMATKEVMVTAPLIVLLYDRTFLAGSFTEALRRRRGLYVGLAATWCVLACLVFSTGLIARQPELGAPNPWGYARSQPGVILHYLRLSVWPSSLCMSYDWPVANTLWGILPGTIVVGLLLAAAVWGLTRQTAWGFLGAWFFLILAPTSSIMPLNQLVHEHRMYLSLAALAALVVTGGYILWDRLLSWAGQGGQSPFSPRMTPGEPGLPGAKKGTVPAGATAVRWAAPAVVFAVVLASLGYATVARNSVYESPVAIWQDGVDKNPNNPMAQNNLAAALVDLGRTDEAIQHCQQALRLKPGYAEAHNNLGLALSRSGRIREAIEHYHEALQQKPDYAKAYHNLGDALVDMGKADEAISCYQRALQLRPDYAIVHNNLGVALASVGQADQAMEHYDAALQLKPDFPDVHNNWGVLLATLGKADHALAHYREAVRLKPDHAMAHNNLGLALAGLGRTEEAIAHYNQALRLEPNSAAIVGSLAWLLATREPAQGGDPARAVQLAERALELAGQDNLQGLDTLAVAYAAAGRFDDAVTTAERALQRAESTGQAPATQAIRFRLELYRAGRPYREAPPAATQPVP